ncbi:PEP-CTERM system TPR-repeat protein PrsT [Magnetospira thiophila]
MHSRSTTLRHRLATSIFTGLLMALTLTACDDGTPEKVTRSSQSYMEEAKDLAEQGDIRGAIIQAKNVLRENPDHIEARLLIGNTYLNAGDAWNAEREFIAARDLKAPVEDWLPPLSRTWISLGKSEDVLKITLPETATTSETAQLITQKGRAYMALKQYDDARKSFEEALAMAPNLADPYLGLARLAFLDSNIDTVASRLKEAEKLAPGSAEVLSLTGDLAMAQGRAADAEVAFIALGKMMPGNPVPIIALTRAQIMAQKIDEAEENTKKLYKSLPDLPLVTYLRAMVAYMKKDYKTTDKLTSQMLATDADNKSVLLIAGASKYALGEYEQAAKFIGGYLADNPDEERARRLYGATLYQLGHGDKAMEVLRTLAEEKQDDSQLLALIGAAAMQAQDMESSRLYIEKVAQLKPDDAATQAQLGSIKINLGMADEGVKNLERAVELDPQMETAVFTLFATLLKERQFEKAHELAKRIQKEKPDQSVGFSMQGIVHIAEGDLNKARDAFAQSLKADPGAVDAAKNMASLEIGSKNYDAARTYLTQGIEHNPKNSDLMMMLAKLEATVGDDAATRSWVQKAVEATPDAIPPRLALARIHLQDNNPVKALGVTQSTLLANPENAELMKVVAQAQLMAGEFANAADTLRRLVKVEPDQSHNYFLLATAYLNTKDRRRLIDSLEKVVELTPMHRDSRLMLSRLYIEDGKYADATKLYEPMKPAEGVDAEILELEAMSTLGQGKAAETVSLLESGLPKVKDPSRNLIVLLSAAQWRAEQTDAAQTTLLNWLSTHEDDTPARLIYATRAMDLGQKQDAVREFKIIVEKNPKNWVARNNLAWTLFELGDLKAAQAEAEGALRVAPDQAPVVDTAGVIFLANNNIPNALVNLRRVVDMDPAAPSYRLHLAQALIKSGEPKEAITHLKRALSSDRPFAGRDEATALLNSLAK